MINGNGRTVVFINLSLDNFKIPVKNLVIKTLIKKKCARINNNNKKPPHFLLFIFFFFLLAYVYSVAYQKFTNAKDAYFFF